MCRFSYFYRGTNDCNLTDKYICRGVASVDFTHNLPDHFSGTYNCLNSSEATFNCIGEKITLISIISIISQKPCAYSLKWLEHYRVSNHQKLDCVFNSMARLLSLKTSKLHLLLLCEWNPPVTGGFSLLGASKSDNSSVPWRHHAVKRIVLNDVVTYATIILTNRLTCGMDKTIQICCKHTKTHIRIHIIKIHL